MKLVIIIGNAAVGKMTVGQELAKITHPNYLRIENADIPPEEAARMIQEHFAL